MLILGDARIDASAGAGPGARVILVALAGDTARRTPDRPGSRVTGSGFSLFGDRKIEVAPGDGPEIRVDAFPLFGNLQVSDRPSV